jgi:hypothetical protein
VATNTQTTTKVLFGNCLSQGIGNEKAKTNPENNKMSVFTVFTVQIIYEEHEDAVVHSYQR